MKHFHPPPPPEILFSTQILNLINCISDAPLKSGQTENVFLKRYIN